MTTRGGRLPRVLPRIRSRWGIHSSGTAKWEQLDVLRPDDRLDFERRRAPLRLALLVAAILPVVVFGGSGVPYAALIAGCVLSS